MFICKCLGLNYSRHLEQQIGIFHIIYCVKNILLYCNKCMQHLLWLFMPAFNYLWGWVGVMVVVLAGQRAQCWVCPCLCPCPHWRAASNTALKLFWNERIKHTFLCWNIFTKHYSLFLIWGRQNGFVTLTAGALPGCSCPLYWGHMGHLQVKLLWSAFARRSRNYVAVVWSNENNLLKNMMERKRLAPSLFELSYTFSQLKPRMVMKRDSPVTGGYAEPSVPLFLWTWKFQPVYFLLNRHCVLVSKQIWNARGALWSAEKGVWKGIYWWCWGARWWWMKCCRGSAQLWNTTQGLCCLPNDLGLSSRCLCCWYYSWLPLIVVSKDLLVP